MSRGGLFVEEMYDLLYYGMYIIHQTLDSRLHRLTRRVKTFRDHNVKSTNWTQINCLISTFNYLK